MSKKWRDHKSLLSSKYVRRYFEDVVWAAENPDALVVPPTSNCYITDEQWKAFVASRMDPKFLELRKKN